MVLEIEVPCVQTVLVTREWCPLEKSICWYDDSIQIVDRNFGFNGHEL